MKQLGGRRRQWHLLQGISLTQKAERKQIVFPLNGPKALRTTEFNPRSRFLPSLGIVFEREERIPTGPCVQQTCRMFWENWDVQKGHWRTERLQNWAWFSHGLVAHDTSAPTEGGTRGVCSESSQE